MNAPMSAAFFPKSRCPICPGFRFEQKIGDRFEGEHEVRVVVRNMRDEEDEKRIPVVATEVVDP